MIGLHCPSLKHVGFDSRTLLNQGLNDLIKIQTLVSVASVAVVVFQSSLFCMNRLQYFGQHACRPWNE